MSQNQYNEESGKPAFISPAARFKVPTQKERHGANSGVIRQLCLPGEVRVSKRVALAVTRRATDGRVALDALIAKDTACRAVKDAQRKERKAKRQADLPSCMMPAGQFAESRPAKKKTKRQRRREKRAARARMLPREDRRDWRERREEYESYINSSQWRMFRYSILRERGYRCEQCWTRSGIMHLHHLHYRNFMHEKPEDVKILCEPCHRAVHAK